MTFHTQCLSEVLYLCVLVFPSAYIYFLKPFIMIDGNTLLSENLSTVTIYGLLTLLGFLTGTAGALHMEADLCGIQGGPGLLIYPVAAAAGFFNIAAEYAEASFSILRRTGKLPALRPAGIYRGRFSFVNLVSVIAAAGLEEMVFRQYMIGGLFESLGVPVWTAVMLSACFYGMNHVYFGRFAVLQKITSGTVFSILYVISGNNITVSILCHVTQNLFLYFHALSKSDARPAGKGGAV